MDRYNEKGKKLLEYKTELIKDYPQLVRDALVLSLDKMRETQLLDEDTYEKLKLSEDSFDFFKQYLITKKDYTKTEAEIFEEFEKLREILNATIHETEGLEEVRTENNTKKDKISIVKKYSIDEDFTLQYFGVSEEDSLGLMKRRGFIEKFSVLRLTKIMTDFMRNLSYQKDLLECDISLSFYDEETNSYAIEILFDIDISLIENNVDLHEVCNEVKRIKNLSDEYYDKRIIV